MGNKDLSSNKIDKYIVMKLKIVYIKQKIENRNIQKIEILYENRNIYSIYKIVNTVINYIVMKYIAL